MLVHDQTSKSFQPRFKEEFRVFSIKGNSVEVKNSHGLLSTFHITDIRKTTMAEKVKELLPDFKKFGRKGKLCMNPDLFKDLGWTLDRDPPDITVFSDNSASDKSQESVENTIKGVTQNTIETQNNIQVHSAKLNMAITAQKTKLRRYRRLKVKITNATRIIRNAIKGNSEK